MKNIESNTGEIVMYQPDETIRLEVRVEDETVWLNRQQMASLFGRDVKTIGKHINNALKEELANVPTVANFAIVQIEGGRRVNRTIEFYNLDMGHGDRHLGMGVCFHAIFFAIFLMVS